jgi:hypothetical protein
MQICPLSGAANRSLTIFEPVCGISKRKSENAEQRLALKYLEPKRNILRIASQRLRTPI